MRCGVRRDITLVHGIAAIKEHCIRHFGAIEMRPRWPTIFTDDDFGRPGYAIAMPIAGRLGRKCSEGMFDIRWNFFAARAEKDNCYPSQKLSQTAQFHGAAHIIVWV